MLLFTYNWLQKLIFKYALNVSQLDALYCSHETVSPQIVGVDYSRVSMTASVRDPKMTCLLDAPTTQKEADQVMKNVEAGPLMTMEVA